MIELLQGDCLELMRLMPNKGINLIVADPPYGARRPTTWRAKANQFKEIKNNDRAHVGWLTEAFRVLADGGAAYVFTCWDKLGEWQHAITSAGFNLRSCIVWDKLDHGMGDTKTTYGPQHELILFAAKGRHVLRGSRPKDILRVQKLLTKMVHPYQKPVALIEQLIVSSSDPGQTVLDCFMGSATTGIAALKTHRNFIGMELDQAYFAVAQKRIEEAQAQGQFNL